ncbi:MAG TPA: carbohydrate ABC transporter permease [Anaerolineales bacterium]|nr:carbohydrate ABC transporter permease [Anaerolineales bacterium]
MNKSSLQRIRKGLSRGLLYALLIAGGLVMIVPFAWMISTSLKSGQYVLSMPPQLIPNPATLDSYRRIFELYPIGRMLFNSLFVAGLTTIGQLVTCSMAAYAFARLKFRGHNFVFLLYLATLMVPFQVTITPLFIMMRIFGWINTYQGLILPGVFSAFGTFMLRQAFMTIPTEYEEAAYMDGASPLTIFLKIILPLSKPALATLSVFAFMGSWNSFMWPLFIVREETLMTLPVGLATLQGRWLTEWNLVMAGAVITVLPMLLLYLFAQKYLVQGYVMSGLKG